MWPRVCPPARYFASPSAAAKILKASSRVSAREYEKGAGFTSALPPGNAVAVFRDVDRLQHPPWRYRCIAYLRAEPGKSISDRFSDGDRNSAATGQRGPVRVEPGGR